MIEARSAMAAAIEAVSGHCGLDAATERHRFESIAAALDALPENDSSWPGSAGAVLELVLGYRAGGGVAFGYLTGGRETRTLPTRLRHLLGVAIERYLDGGGDTARATVLADLFAACFPDVGVLSRFAPSSQAMVVGFGPHAGGLDLKVYFNTRMIPGDQSTRVARAAELVGLDPRRGLELYGALYDPSSATCFMGVGVDVGAAVGRLKLYVRVPSEHARSHVRSLGRQLEVDGSLDDAQALLESVPSELQTSEVEVGVSYRAGNRVSLKVTCFYAQRASSDLAHELLITTCQRLGHDPAPARSAFAALRAHAPAAQVLHGLGVESSDRAPAKLNVYLRGG